MAGDEPAAPLADRTSLASSPTIQVEQLVFHYFLSNFVLLPGIEGRRGFLDFLLPLLRNEPPDSHLSVSFKAVALAAFGNRPNSKKLLVQASSEYSRALSSTNTALANPVMQKSDQTLAAVLLLGLFEVSEDPSELGPTLATDSRHRQLPYVVPTWPRGVHM